MKKLFAVCAIIGGLSLASALAAEKNSDESGPSRQPRTIFKKSEHHQFAGTRLKGQFKKPDLSYIYQRKGLRAERIIEFPEDFNEEIESGSRQF